MDDLIVFEAKEDNMNESFLKAIVKATSHVIDYMKEKLPKSNLIIADIEDKDIWGTLWIYPLSGEDH